MNLDACQPLEAYLETQARLFMTALYSQEAVCSVTMTFSDDD